MIMVGAAVAGEEGEGKASGDVVEETAVAAAEAGVGGEGLGHVAGVGGSDSNRHGCDLGKAEQDRIHGGWRRTRRDRGEPRDHREEAVTVEEIAESRSEKGNRRTFEGITVRRTGRWRR